MPKSREASGIRPNRFSRNSICGGTPGTGRLIGIRWSSDALDDLDRIDAFNLTRNKDWTRRVQHRIGERCASLAMLPFQGRPIGGGLRQLSINDVQYVVIYGSRADYVIIQRAYSTRENRDQP